MTKRNYFIVIAGPTGVGKTDTALNVAEALPVEIINADVGQFYTPLTIGTAKPNWQESDIPHHLFDSIDKPENITVAQYREKVRELCEEIWGRNKIPLIVGGSHFYISSLFFPPNINESIKQHTYDDYSTQELWDELQTIDAKRAEEIHFNDRYRLERALNIWHSTGIQPSEYKPSYNPLANNYSVLFLTRDRNHLYKRIDERTVQMLREGWIEEVEKLVNTEWKPFLYEKKIIGYDDILQYLQLKEHATQKDYIQLQNTISQKTRNYAKRQMTYWRMLETKLSTYKNENHVETINLDHESPESFRKKLAGFLSTLYTSQLKREDHGR